MTTPDRYTWTQIALHWLIAALVLFEIFFERFAQAGEHAMRGSSLLNPVLVTNPHFLVGLLILVLTLWRVVLRFMRGAPAAPAEEPTIFQWAAKLAHLAFYLLLFATPITGLLRLAIRSRIIGELHEWAKPAFLILIAIHVVAVLVHQFLWKTNVFGRMIGRA
ncbi:MAG: cytochrome b [Hyphomicrobiaceae bacterium]|nr:cytochrome b [Hyphomicrobiaceae bacterium]